MPGGSSGYSRTAIQAERKSFEAVLDAWRSAKTEGNMQRLLGFTPPTSRATKIAAEQMGARTASRDPRSARQNSAQDKSYLRWTDSTDTMVVTFGEVAAVRAPSRQAAVLDPQGAGNIFEGEIG